MRFRFSGLFTVVLAALISSFASADTVIFSDNFDSYSAGQVIGGAAGTSDWNPKWDSNDATQQNLFTGDGNGAACLDTSNAKLNYHIPSQTAFTVDLGETICIESDFQFTHNGMGGPANVNENAFGLLLTQGQAWFSGPNKDFSIAMRGGAVGNRLPFNPWIENWMSYGSLGVDINAGVDQVSDWINVKWTLSVNAAGNIEGVATYTDIATPSNTFSSTAVDLGWAAGTTVYAGYTTAWNDGGNTATIEDNSNISKVAMDNFSIVDITPVPEPSSMIALLGLGTCLITRRRR